MITQMEVFVNGISTPPFPIMDNKEALDLIQILNVDGLGPSKADINTTPYGSIDGTFFNGSSSNQRNIVLTLKLNPDWVNYTPEILRRTLYSYFLPETQVKLRFTSTHMPVVEITGYVESCEPTLFAKDSTLQISIICPQPYFIASAPSQVSGITSAIGSTDSTIITYQGDVPVGFVINVNNGGNSFTGEIRVINQTPVTKLFSVTNTIDANYNIEIGTAQGSKYAHRASVSGPAYQNILGSVLPGSIWIPLVKGDNVFRVLSTTAGLGWTLQYQALYGGL